MQTAEQTGYGLGTEEVRRRQILVKALVVGLVAGVMASGFRLAIAWAERARIAWLEGLPQSSGWVAALVLGTVGGGLSVWLVRRWAPESAGSGIPHLKTVLRGDEEMRWWRVLPVKFLAGIVGIGSGLALGREGPTVQMGGATGIMVSRWFRVKPGEGERKALISAGAGAGLASAFNAPLAGMIFVLEELQGNFTPVVFVAAFLASVSADIVGRLLVGGFPVFHFPHLPVPPMGVLVPALGLGLLAGLGGVIFNACLLRSLDLFDRLRRGRLWVGGAVAGAIAGVAGWYYPGVAGGGGGLTEQALIGEVALMAVPVLLLVRFALTMLSYGCGAAGGIFAPLLVLGALSGLLVGRGAHALAPTWLPQPEVFAILGMGALFTAIVRAPLTGIVLMVEMTGEYGFMLPLLVSCLAAYGVAEGLGSPPIYEALRIRSRAREYLPSATQTAAPPVAPGATASPGAP